MSGIPSLSKFRTRLSLPVGIKCPIGLWILHRNLHGEKTGQKR